MSKAEEQLRAKLAEAKLSYNDSVRRNNALAEDNASLRSQLQAVQAREAALREEYAGYADTIVEMRKEAVVSQAQNVALTDMLVEVINQSCVMPDGMLNSMAVSAYGDALVMLAECGRVVVDARRGHNVTAHWKKPEAE